MSSFSKSDKVDLENGRQGVLPNSTRDELQAYGLGPLMLYELRALREILSVSNVELKKIRNKLWNIEDVLGNPKNEPEYEVEEH